MSSMRQTTRSKLTIQVVLNPWTVHELRFCFVYETCEMMFPNSVTGDVIVAMYSYERSCRCRSTPERRLHPLDSSPSSVSCPPPPPPPVTAAAVSSDDAPLTSTVPEPPLYGSAALLHRGIYASVRIRASRDPRSAAGPTATPELVTVLPGSAKCKCASDDERRTLPARYRCCRDDYVHDKRSRHALRPPFCSTTVPAVPHNPTDSARTRSLLVVARPTNNACPECHTTSLVPNTIGQNTELHRNYGTASTTA